MNDKITNKIEFGDWQTPESLSRKVCALIQKENPNPQIVIEPTCGRGSFIVSALKTFTDIEEVIGIEINPEYIKEVENKLSSISHKAKITLINSDALSFDFHKLAKRFEGKNILILGNPPWVTNSELSGLRSNNVPCKGNFKSFKGIEAATGKGNFDIAEYITLQLFSAFQNSVGSFAFLVKNSVVKNLLLEQPKNHFTISGIKQYLIDTKKEFNVSVAASLLTTHFNKTSEATCAIYDFYDLTELRVFGWNKNSFVSDISQINNLSKIDGVCQFIWRSGVKHDCSKVMELRQIQNSFYNGLKEKVSIEEKCIYPLVKSSHLQQQNMQSERFIIITQRSTSDDTSALFHSSPLTYSYLNSHGELLDNRKSVIYKKRPRFCLFGIGDYSFKPYKVAISGLYKNYYFALLSPIKGKPIMTDDTCYQLGFDDYDDALVVQKTLNSEPVKLFLKSIAFSDAKRPITKEVLMRIDLKKICENFTAKDIQLSQVEFGRLKRLVCTQTEELLL